MAKILIGLCLVNNPLSDAKKLDMGRVIVGGYIKVNGFIVFNTENLEMERISLSDALDENILNLEIEYENFENDYYKSKHDTRKLDKNCAFSYGKWLLVYGNKVVKDKPSYCISIRIWRQRLLYHIDKIRSINNFNLDIRINALTCYIICSKPISFIDDSMGSLVVNVKEYNSIEEVYPREFIGERGVINLPSDVTLWSTSGSSGNQDILPNGIKILVIFFDGYKDTYNIVIPPSVEYIYFIDLGSNYDYNTAGTLTVTFYISNKNKLVLLDALHDASTNYEGYDTNKVNVIEY